MRITLPSLLIFAIAVAVCNSEPEPKAQYYSRPYYYGGEAIVPRVAGYIRDSNVALQNPSPVQDPRFFGFTTLLSLINPLFTLTYSTSTLTITSTSTSSCTTSTAALAACTLRRRRFADLDDEHRFLKPSPVERYDFIFSIRNFNYSIQLDNAKSRYL